MFGLDRARIVVALDADFLDGLPGSVRYARDFVAARSLQSNSTLHRFYAVESTPSLTGAQADRRLALPARQVEDVATASDGSLYLFIRKQIRELPLNGVAADRGATSMRAHRYPDMIESEFV